MPSDSHLKLRYTLEPAADVKLKLEQQRKELEQNLKIKGPFTEASRQVKTFASELDRANQRVITLGASFAVLSTSIRTMKDLVSSTVEVENAFNEINSVFGLSVRNLDAFSKQLFNTARETSQSFDKAANAAKEFSRQGLSAEETIRRTRDALILTRLANLDVASAVETLTASINGFQKSALSSTQVVNKLATVDAQFAVSSKDLAEGLARAGSAASDAGVSFDQLLGLITAAQQTTARGGAVIGNSLKTIFTRVERRETIEAFEGLGVAVRDAEGNILQAIPLLENFARTYDKLGGTVKKQAAELVGGVFQINVLKAILSDLAGAQSIFAGATETSTKATDEAIRRNEALNQSLDSLITKFGITSKQIGANVGSLTFAEPLRTLLNLASNNPLVSMLEDASGKAEGEGAKLAQGLLKGIGGALIYGLGPLVAVAIGKVINNTFSNLRRDFADLTGLTSEAQKQKAIQIEVLNIYRSGGSALQQQLATMKDITAQAAYLNRLLQTSNPVGSSLMAAEIMKVRRATPRSAEGYIPSAAGGYAPEQQVPNAAGGLGLYMMGAMGRRSGPGVANIVNSYRESFNPTDSIRLAQANAGETYYPVLRDRLKNIGGRSGQSLEKLAYGMSAISANAPDNVVQQTIEKLAFGMDPGKVQIYPRNILKAQSILASSGEEEELIRLLGSGAKTQNFAAEIAGKLKVPSFGKYKSSIGDPAVMDSWALYVQRGGALAPNYDRSAVSDGERSKLFSTSRGGYGNYNNLAIDYNEASQFLGLPISRIQGRTWGWARGQPGSSTRNMFGAAGYVPMAEEAASIARGVGGAPSNARPVYLPNFNRGNGQRGIVANTSEWRVPMGNGEAILNRSMVARMGRLPPGARPVAAQGYVPNAALGAPDFNVFPFNLLPKSVAGEQRPYPYNILPSALSGPQTTSAELEKAKKAAREKDLSEERIRRKNLEAEQKAAQIKIKAAEVAAKIAEEEKARTQAEERAAADRQRRVREEQFAKAKVERTDQQKDEEAAAARREKASEKERKEYERTAERAYRQHEKMYPPPGRVKPDAAVNQKNVRKWERELEDYREPFEQEKAARITASRERAREDAEARAGRMAFLNWSANRDLDKGRGESYNRWLTQAGLSRSASKMGLYVSPEADRQLEAAGHIKYPSWWPDENTSDLDAQKMMALRMKQRAMRGMIEQPPLLPTWMDRNMPTFAPWIRQMGQSKIGMGGRGAFSSIGKSPNAGFGLSLGLPLAAGFIDEGVGGTSGGMARGAVSSAFNTAGFGASVGMLFGPQGAVAGAGIGAAVGGLYGAIKKSTKSFEEVARDIQEANSKVTSEMTALSEVFRYDQEYRNALSSKASKERLYEIRKASDLAFQGLSPQVREIVNNRFNDSNAQKTATEILVDRQRATRPGQDLLSSAVGAQQDTSVLFGPNKKSIDRMTDGILAAFTKLSRKEVAEIVGKSRTAPVTAVEMLGSKVGLTPEQVKNLTAEARLAQAGSAYIGGNKFSALSALGPAAMSMYTGSYEALFASAMEKASKKYLEIDAGNPGGNTEAGNLKAEDDLKTLQRKIGDLDSLISNYQLASESRLKVEQARQEVAMANPSLGELDKIDLSSRYGLENLSMQMGMQRFIAPREAQGQMLRILKDGGASKEAEAQIAGITDAASAKALLASMNTPQSLIPSMASPKLIEVLNALIVSLEKIDKTEEEQSYVLREFAKIRGDQYRETLTLGYAKDEDQGAVGRATEAYNGMLDRRDSSDILDRGEAAKIAAIVRQERRLGLKTEAEVNASDINSSMRIDSNQRRRTLEALKVLGLDARIGFGKQDTDTAYESGVEQRKVDVQVAEYLRKLMSSPQGRATEITLGFREARNSYFRGMDREDVDLSVAKRIQGVKYSPREMNRAVNNGVRRENQQFTDSYFQAQIDARIGRRLKLEEGERTSRDQKASDAELQKLFRGGSITEGQLRLGRLESRQRRAAESAFASGSDLRGSALATASERGLQGDAQGSFLGGFRASIQGAKRDLMDFSDVGLRVADNLRNGMTDAWTGWVTGARSAKDAFRDFATSVLSDASRMLASKAFSSALSMIPGFAGPMGATGGEFTGSSFRFARGGLVPAMLTGGEIYIGPSTAKKIGYDKLRRINAYQGLASGGMADVRTVRGGSGVRDDVAAKLPSGSFIIKKSTAQRLGPDYFRSLANGQVQHRWLGGALMGALIGGGIGYATGGKKGAIGGALVGGIAGGLYSAYQGAPIGGDGLRHMAPLGAGTKLALGMGASAGLGLLAAGIGEVKEAPGPISLEQVPAYRRQLEAEQSKLLGSRGGQQVMLEINPQGGYSMTGLVNTPATRRWGSGGLVQPFAGFADGGEVAGGVTSPSLAIGTSTTGSSSTQAPQVYVKIDINNDGTVSSSRQANGEGSFGRDFAQKMEKQVRSLVQDELVRQSRPDGFFAQKSRITGS